MVMRNGRDSGNAQQHWWDDLPPAIRRRFRNVIQEQLLQEEEWNSPPASPVVRPTTLPSEGSEREFVWDLLRLTGTFLLVIFIVLLLMLGCVTFLSNGGHPGPWPF
ncbi:MAG: hypothetical protein WHU94_00795 [Thermogemmata sp.]|jgi:hypothetical protein|uniref:Uncharacterized protein n=1 Tax=Thermogemmata fonticola TaxID=2755323 RepID=A0A7V8VC83_9BACT|nr:hypothetical protein [Thermogemmata fonticola]MBA2225087.1 hypothetical protein [Thermogemmata fonticola]MCX8138732.1 hypothetical protein [Gemmataceae bacterium]GIW84460.1 MAG: hypothetical protein KatS3mg107_0120 [Gemmataceae bacterium]